MTPWWPWEYVQLSRPLWAQECCLWLIISWYPTFKWLPHLDKTITAVVLQMLCYTRNIILITKQQLVASCPNFPELARPCFGLLFFLCSITAANGNVPQEGPLLAAFASKHSWGWCYHYVRLLGVLVICGIPRERGRTPRGEGERTPTCRKEQFRSSGLAGGMRAQGKKSHKESSPGCVMDAMNRVLISQQCFSWK